MTPLDYEYLRKLLKERSGLDLSADKQYLVESRLVPLARRCQALTFDPTVRFSASITVRPGSLRTALSRFTMPVTVVPKWSKR